MSSLVLDPPILSLHHLVHPNNLPHSPVHRHDHSPPAHDISSPPSTQPSEPMPATPQDDPPRVSTPSIGPNQQVCCANCGAVKTPLWRRDAEGKTVCNACGLYQKNRNTPRPTSLSRRGSQQPVGNPAALSSPSAPPSSLPAKDASKQTGTCPGDGRCNGTGGNSSCSGCPTFNNSHGHPTTGEPAQHTDVDADVDEANEQRKVGGLSCANCKTSTTPLWRRDDMGNNICNACGLYFKLHGTHRPFSMKKAIIKRRKRVPAAASATPGRLSDQAAAEALVSVGRGVQSTEEDEGEPDEPALPKRKRQRRSSTRGGMGSGSRRRDSRDDDGGSASPHYEPHHQSHSTHSGLDLPPLAHLMPQADMAMFPYMVGAPGMFPKTMYHAVHSVPPPASSYVRSSSRAQSPSGGMPSLPPPPGVSGLFLSGNRLSPSGSGLPAIPTLDELQSHYRELEVQKRAMADVLERTERLMEGVRRGIESAGGSVPGTSLPPLAALTVPSPQLPPPPPPPQQQQQHQQQQAPMVEDTEMELTVPSSPIAIPLPRSASTASRNSPRESVWPVVAGSPREA